MSTTFYRCRCYLWSNFYVSNVSIHVTYQDKAHFRERYYQILREKGLKDEEIETTIQELEKEKCRRSMFIHDSLKRKQVISSTYQRLHPDIFCLKESYLRSDFVELVKLCQEPTTTKDSLCKQIKSNLGKELFSFPVFTEEFCCRFIEEIENFEKSDSPKGRPNTMNHNGISLDELGFYENFITPLREKYLNPLCRILFPEWTRDGLDSHKAFIAVYKIDQDIDLSTHYDNAEVTLNISLGKSFDEGSLYIGRMRNEPRSDTDYVEFTHTQTHGLLHRGQQLHGAMPIEDGERYNLIIWMRSSSRRNQLCPMCDQEPDLEVVPKGHFGDGFTASAVEVCSLH